MNKNVKFVWMIIISLKIQRIALKTLLKDIISMKRKKYIQNVMINVKHVVN